MAKWMVKFGKRLTYVLVGWNKQGTVEQVLKIYREFDPAVRALISKVDPLTLKVWQLLDMEKLPAWTTGKLVLLGDAAHPFTPRKHISSIVASCNANWRKTKDKGSARQ